MSATIDAHKLRDTLRELRNKAHYDYMGTDDRITSEIAARERDFCESLAEGLGLELGKVPR